MPEIIKPHHFIRQIIENDLKAGKHAGNVVTRFPPEPNGYLHIGHAKSICLNFTIAAEYSGVCNLRFDDTNPIKEEQEYVDSIMQDIRWLGFDWQQNLFYASDYFEQLYQFAIELIEKDLAYIESFSMEEIREYRGTLTAAGKRTPDRDRPVAESLDLFARMRDGEFPDGKYVLRAKIDMNSGNINLRDPVIYRIRHSDHQRTQNKWCIYPMYDFAHSLSDAIEGITHSLCTLEFQDHRPLYDWFIDNVATPSKPQQIEFARLNLTHTITSKRKLKVLVDNKLVESWDDPRMPTLSGMRRRGFPPQAIRDFCEMIGISKSDSIIPMDVLEQCVRAELNQHAPRAMAVLDPLKIIISNYSADEEQCLTIANHPQDPRLGTRELVFTREIYIERADFLESPTKKFFRLAPGKEVRLRHAYVIKCETVIKDANGNITELHCSYDPDTYGKKPEGRKVKGVIHWLPCRYAQTAEIRLYDRLFNVENPAAVADFIQAINPESLKILPNCYIEPSLLSAQSGETFQFERLGYFCVDSQAENLTFNRVVSLRNTWEKIKS